MRRNPLQIGFSILMGWFLVFVSASILQPFIHLGGAEMFWGVLVLGLSLIGFGFMMRDQTGRPQTATTLLQIGAVVTILWVMILMQMEGPYDLGLPKPYVVVGYTVDGVPITTPLMVILFLGVPILGLSLLALGFMLNRRTKR